MTCTTGTDKDKGDYYIFQHIASLVWARKPVVRFAPLVRLTPLSPTVAIISSLSVKTQLSSVFFMLVKRSKSEGAKCMKNAHAVTFRSLSPPLC